MIGAVVLLYHDQYAAMVVISCHGAAVIGCHGAAVISCRGATVISCRGATVISCHGATVISCHGAMLYYEQFGSCYHTVRACVDM